jgi:two-component system chemotaxis response regulator CheY
MVTAMESNQKLASRPILDLSNLRFLVVDDNPFIRSLAKSLLRTFGAKKLLEAEDGTTALEHIEREEIDIILTNWEMRPMSGRELVSKLRKHPKQEKQMIPVILMTGHSSLADVTEARDFGVNEFLAKPLSPKELYLRVESVILRPRVFIRSKGYCGPDRHRRNDANYKGPRRRQSELGLSNRTP